VQTTLIAPSDDPKEELFHSHATLASNDFGGSAVMYETEAPNHDTKADRFDARLAINPKMIYFGMTVFFYEMGTSIVYQCAPPLANDAGEKHVKADLHTCDNNVQECAITGHGKLPL